MTQHKLCKGMFIGALVGGAIMLFDKGTRRYVTSKTRRAGASCKKFAAHPSEAVHSLRMNYESLAHCITNGIDDVLMILNKAEEALHKLSDIEKDVSKQLEAVDDPKKAS
ncbi:YtxH domain-containing protein [Halobacillus shinanisalinarum]|uniref:YtxH domain-containing protein n=1 Tax=Halobacillus shinanisalinarum TaxID=2932258 RepID=A0ABY4GX68_9BACI|nr:YtxH domain-containing protein [Halobacillus shinanisalinarum]UOQ92519.1 YtxH domain-containing protein [Halobacillus shinanisalinarum]